jgi:hypothetical protein
MLPRWHDKAHQAGGPFHAVSALGARPRELIGTLDRPESTKPAGSGLRCNQSILIRTDDLELREDAQSDHFA